MASGRFGEGPCLGRASSRLGMRALPEPRQVSVQACRRSAHASMTAPRPKPWRYRHRGVIPPRFICLHSGQQALTSPVCSLDEPDTFNMKGTKTYDVVSLANLCVDVLVPVPVLPAKDPALLQALKLSTTGLFDVPGTAKVGSVGREVGANANTLIAAARLGLRSAAVGLLGRDPHGDFFRRVLREEGIDIVPFSAPTIGAGEEPGAGATPGRVARSELEESTRVHADAFPEPDESPFPTSSDTPARVALDPLALRKSDASVFSTLLCFVLLDPMGMHTFCSSYDFGPWPLLKGVALGDDARVALTSTRALFVNGFAFDDLPAKLVLESARLAKSAGAAVFFDPGPRASTFATGPRRAALVKMLATSDVVLMTEDESADVVGTNDAGEAAAAVLGMPGSITSWCVVKRGASGAILVVRGDRVDATKNKDPSVRLPGPPESDEDDPRGHQNGASHGSQTDNKHSAVLSVYVSPSFPVPVADTVGCGDSLAAAVMLGFTRSPEDPGGCLALACAVGAATALRPGAGRAVARVDEVGRILEDSADARQDVIAALQLLNATACTETQ